MILTGQQISDELKTLGFERVEGPWDDSYLVPHSKWLDEFGAWWTKEILPTLKYEENEFDCDDFSRRCGVEVTKSVLVSGVIGSAAAFFYRARLSHNRRESVQHRKRRSRHQLVPDRGRRMAMVRAAGRAGGAAGWRSRFWRSRFAVLPRVNLRRQLRRLRQFHHHLFFDL